MIRVETIQRTSPSKRECEDALSVHREAGVYAVMDGATPLVPYQDENGHNGAYLAANTFKKYFERMEPIDQLTNSIQHANQDLYDQMVSSDVDVTKGYERWTTCVAAVKLDDSTLSFAHLGDCMILVVDVEGKIKVVTKDTVKGISQRARKRRERERKEGKPVLEESYFEDKREELKFNRTLANIKGGYTVADGTKAAIDCLQTGKIPLKELKEVLMISDGLFHPNLSLENVYKEIQQVGLESYVHQLTRLLEGRSAHIDDRTAIRIIKNA